LTPFIFFDTTHHFGVSFIRFAGFLIRLVRRQHNIAAPCIWRRGRVCFLLESLSGRLLAPLVSCFFNGAAAAPTHMPPAPSSAEFFLDSVATDRASVVFFVFAHAFVKDACALLSSGIRHTTSGP